MALLSSSNCSNCEVYKKNIQNIEERFLQYKKLLIHTNKLLEKYDILIQHSKTVEEKLKREQVSSVQVKKILVPLLTQLLPLQNVKNKHESEIKKFEHEIEVLKGIVIAEQQKTKQYSALSSQLEADLKSANAIVENTKEQLNATRKEAKQNATTNKLHREKLHTALQNALELSHILKQNKLLPHKFINTIRAWKKQLNKLDDSFHESCVSSADTGFESSKYCSSDEDDISSNKSLPNFVDNSKLCLRSDIGINTNLSMQNHGFESVMSPLGNNFIEVADIDVCAAKLSKVDMSYSNDNIISPTVSKIPKDMSSTLDEFCESSGSEIGHLEEIEIDHLEETEIDHSEETEIDHSEETEINHSEETEINFLEETDINPLEETEIKPLAETEIHCLEETYSNPPEETDTHPAEESRIYTVEDSHFAVDKPYEENENCDLEEILDNMIFDMPIALSPMMPDGLCDKCSSPKRDVSTMTRVDFCNASTNHDTTIPVNVGVQCTIGIATIPVNVGVQCTIGITDKSCAEVSVQCNFPSNRSEEILNAENEILNQQKLIADKILKNIASSLYNDAKLQHNVMIQILDELKKIYAVLGIRNSVLHEPFCQVKSISENSNIKIEEKSHDSSQICFSELYNASRCFCKSNQYSIPITGNCCSCSRIPSSNVPNNSSNDKSFKKDVSKTKDKHKFQFSHGSVQGKKKLKRLNPKLNKLKLIKSSSGFFFATTNIGSKIFKRSELKPHFNFKRYKIQGIKQSVRKISSCRNSLNCHDFTSLPQVSKQRRSKSDMARSSVNFSTPCPASYSTNSRRYIDREEMVDTNINVIQDAEENSMHKTSLPVYSENTSELSSEFESESESECRTENIPQMNNKFVLNATNLSNDPVICSPNSVTCIGREDIPDTNVNVMLDSEQNTMRKTSLPLYSDKSSELSSESESESEFRAENKPENNKLLLNVTNVNKNLANFGTCIDREDMHVTNAINAEQNTVQKTSLPVDSELLSDSESDSQWDSECLDENIPVMKSLLNASIVSNDASAFKCDSYSELGKVKVIRKDKDSTLLSTKSPIINCSSNVEQNSALDNTSTDVRFEEFGVLANFNDGNVSNMPERIKDLLKSNECKSSTVALFEEGKHYKSNEVKNIIYSSGSESEDGFESDNSSENIALAQSSPICKTSKSDLADISVETNAGNFDVNDDLRKTFKNIETGTLASTSNVLPMSMSNHDLEQNQIEKSNLVYHKTLICHSKNMVESHDEKTSSSEIKSDCDKARNNSHKSENDISRKVSTKSVVCRNFFSPAAVVRSFSNTNRSLKAKALASEFKENFQKKSTKCQVIECNSKELKANVPVDKRNVETLFGNDNDLSDELTAEQSSSQSKLCYKLKPVIKSSLHKYSEELNAVNLISRKIKPVLKKATSYSHIQSVGLPEIPIKRTKSLPIFFQSPVSLKSFDDYKTCSRRDQKSMNNFEQFERKGIKRTNLYLSTKQCDTGVTKININENLKEVECTISPGTFTPSKRRIAHIPGERNMGASSEVIDKKLPFCKPLTTSSFEHSENSKSYTPSDMAQKNNFGDSLTQKCQSEEFEGCKSMPKATTLSKLSCESNLNQKNVKPLSKLGMLRQQFIKQKRKYKIMVKDEMHKNCQTAKAQVIPTETTKRLCIRNEADVEFDTIPRSSVKIHTPISPKHVSNVNSDYHKSELFSDSKILHNSSVKSEHCDSTSKLAVSNSSGVSISQKLNINNYSEERTSNHLLGKKLENSFSLPFDLTPSQSIVSDVLTQYSHVIPLNTKSPTEDVSKTNLKEVTSLEKDFGSPKIKSHLQNKQSVLKVDRHNEVEHISVFVKEETNSKHPTSEKKNVNLCETVTSKLGHPSNMSDANKCFIYEKGGFLKTALQLKKNAKEEKHHKNYEGNLKLEMDNFLCKSLTSSTLIEAAKVLSAMSDVQNLSRCIFEIVRNDDSEIDHSFTPPALPLTCTQQKLLTLIMVMQKEFADFTSLIGVFLSAVESFVLKLSYNAPSVNLLCKIVRFYCAVCRIKMCTTRVHAFCYDALYCLKRKCFPLIYTILLCYPEALPNAAVGMGSPRCVAMVHVIMSTNINSMNVTFKLQDLKRLLKQVYGYNNMDELMLDTIMAKTLKKLRYTSSKSREIQASLILLAKIHGSNWTITSLIHKGIIPIIRDWYEDKLPEAPALQSAEILGAVLKAFSYDVDITKEMTVLGGILSNNKASFNLKLATAMSLAKLIGHNYTLVANFLYNWIPEEPVPKKFLMNLCHLMLIKPYSSWMEYLKSKNSTKIS